MSTYEITSPDGHTYEVTAPQGASQQDVMSYVQSHHAANPPQQSPQDAARAAGQQSGEQEGGLLSGVRGLASSATFGTNSLLNAGIRYAGQHLSGVQHPDDFSTDLAYVKGQDEGATAAHPYISAGGQIAGAVVGGGALAKGTAKLAAKAVPALAGALDLQKGQTVRNIMKLVGTGALAGGEYGSVSGGVQGGTDAAAQGGDASQVAQGAATGAASGGATGAVGGAIAGPVVAGAAGAAKFGLNQMAPAAQRAMRVLADKLGMDTATLVKSMDDYRAATGKAPTIQSVLQARDQANVRPLVSGATTSPQSAQVAMQSAADAKAAELPAALRGTVDQGTTKTPFNAPPQSTAHYDEMVRNRDDEMDTAMGARDPLTRKRAQGTLGTQIVGTADHAEQYNNLPDVVAAKQEVPGLKSLLDRALTTKQTYTVDDMDSLRQSLDKLQRTSAASNSHWADLVKNVKEDLVGGVRQLYPAYGDAVDTYARQSAFMEGFEHGNAGKSFHDAPDLTRTPEGMAGIELGARTRLASNVSETEQSALSAAKTLRQGSPSKVLGNLPAAEQDAIKNAAGAHATEQQNYQAMAPDRIASADEAKHRAMQNASEGFVSLAGRALTGFKAHAAYRILAVRGVREDTANALVDELTRVRTPADVSAFTTSLNRARLDAQTRRLMLKQVSRYAGAGLGGSIGSYVSSQLRGSQ